MNFDTPLVEYLIIGTHTSIWIFFIIMKIISFPLHRLTDIDPATVLLILPLIYINGMLFDELTFRPLNSIRERIQHDVFKAKAPKDELLAFTSQSLYTAYEMRVRRVRIIGASIFNWPLLCMSILLHVENWAYKTMLIVLGISLSAISFHVWKKLYYRAYKFRKNAFEVIKEFQTINKVTRHSDRIVTL